MVEEESEGVKEEELDVGVGARHLVPPQQHAEQHVQRDHVHNLVLLSILSIIFFSLLLALFSLLPPFSILFSILPPLIIFGIQEE